MLLPILPLALYNHEKTTPRLKPCCEYRTWPHWERPSTARPAVTGRPLTLPILHGGTTPRSTWTSTHISEPPRFSQSRCTISQPVLLERVPVPPSICLPGLRRQQTVQPCNDDLGFMPPPKKQPSTSASFFLESIISFFQKHEHKTVIFLIKFELWS